MPNQATLIHLHGFIMMRDIALSYIPHICSMIRSIRSCGIFTRNQTPLHILALD